MRVTGSKGGKMINSLYSLKEKYKNSNKYIWNINRDSIVEFLWLAFSKVNIQGFVTDEE